MSAASQKGVDSVLEFDGEDWWPCEQCECNAGCHGHPEGWCHQCGEFCDWSPMWSADPRFYGLTGVEIYTRNGGRKLC